MSDTDAIFVGGPQDGTIFDAQDRALVEVPAEGLVHRYVTTTATREREGSTYRVYNYDGEVRSTEARRATEQS